MQDRVNMDMILFVPELLHLLMAFWKIFTKARI